LKFVFTGIADFYTVQMCVWLDQRIIFRNNEQAWYFVLARLFVKVPRPGDSEVAWFSSLDATVANSLTIQR